MPLYVLVPVPVSTASCWKSFAPVAASVMTCSSLGVPSGWTPLTTVSYARTGLPVAAQTTLRGAASALVFAFFLALDAASALFLAAAGASRASVPDTAIVASVALVTLRAPLFFTCTTRSPPSTGSPAYVRSYRVCTVPSASLTTSRTTSFSLAPRPIFPAVAAAPSWASRSADARWEAES